MSEISVSGGQVFFIVITIGEDVGQGGVNAVRTQFLKIPSAMYSELVVIIRTTIIDTL